MMTLEEAIKLLKQYQGYDPMFPDGETLKHAFDLTDETVDTLLTALRPVSREQVEKIYPGCSRCLARGDRNVLNDPGAHDFRLKDSALVYWDEQYGWEGTKVLFCPWCGSPLTDEAVEITMRRLEALNEED